MGNLTIDQQNELKGKIALGEECGLTFTNELDKDGEPIFIGDNKAWDFYNNGGRY